ncbi:LmbU family transcriptional regulator [Streptomyces sp. QL37]|uniref:LmbU family transcriptional regulator n=1 Tax=Streptomyces sp. QL37 TaxID=2093747 RepID=UPI0016523148|nr:LmbU family transcriptional regulator [Streptomyces sp. QL37]
MNATNGVELGNSGHATRPFVPAQGRRRSTLDAPRPNTVLTTRVGLQIPSKLSFKEWEDAGGQLAGVVDSSSWWLGDWLVYGKDNYADRYQRGIRTAGLKYQTLRNYAWVSRRFSLSRRRAKLSFQHHAEVASLPLKEQEIWLDRAEQGGWTTKLLRNALRDANREGPAAANSPGATRRLSLPDSRVQWWQKAAEQLGVDFENWVLVTLDTAAGSALDEPEAPLAPPSGALPALNPA